MGQIVLDHVTKVYPGGVKGIDDLSLDIADGEFMVLVGPSGCGKSTALRSIAGLEEITSGTISIGAQVVNDLPPKDRDIAMVFQNYALYPHMTVEQNLAFGLQQRKTPKDQIKQRVGEVAGLLGLEDYLKRKPAALSGGQRQRVAMGRAIVREPKAFLMDEPLSNLDAKLRVSMRASLSQLHERLGVTTVYVTHDQVEAMTLGQRVCVMRDGKLQQADSPQALFNSPVNLFVAGFMGSPAMNFADARLVRDDGLAVVFAGSPAARARGAAARARPGLAEYCRPRSHPGHQAVGLRGRRTRRCLSWPRIAATRGRDRGARQRDCTCCSGSTPRRSSTRHSATPRRPTARRARCRSRQASRCGPPGSPRAAGSLPVSRSSSRSRRRTCSSSTPTPACRSATPRPSPPSGRARPLGAWPACRLAPTAVPARPLPGRSRPGLP